MFALCLAVMTSATAAVERSADSNQDVRERAGALLDNGAYADAIRLYETILESGVLEPREKSRVLNNVGFAHYKLGVRAKAIHFYELALEVDPDYATCLNNLGAALINERRFPEAITYLGRAYKLDKTAKVVFNLFAANYYLDRRSQAIAFIEEAMRIDESYTESRLRARNIKQSDIEKLKRRVR